MALPLTKSKQPTREKSADFDILREQGLRYLQDLAGDTWTDHNLADPGVTILEQLCYALADLGYRAAFDMPDLLAEAGRATYASLFSPRTILSGRSVTPTDLRALLIDLPGVKNAWILAVEETVYTRPASGGESKNWDLGQSTDLGEAVNLKGLYKVQVEPARSDLTEEEKESLRSRIFRLLHANRNLGEDFRREDIELLPAEEIGIGADIEIQPGYDPEQILASILFRLRQFISPDLPFYTLPDMLNRGRRMEEIFEGPLLRHGFVDMDELRSFHKRTSLRSSDLIQEIMDVPGVKAVTKITMLTRGEAPKSDPWELMLDAGKAPTLIPSQNRQAPENEPAVRLTVDGLPAGIDPDTLAKKLLELEKAKTATPSSQDLDVFPPTGRDRRIAHYFSIQHHFPDTYGVNETGLPLSTPVERKARARQLKAYLMFFDQILANAFAQLAHARKLLAFEDGPSYAAQSLLPPDATEDTLWLRPLLNKEPDEHLATVRQLTETPARRLNRKNQFLDHLLARFGEELQSYALLLYNLRQGQWEETAGRLITDKVRFLREYPELSAHRGGGFDQTLPVTDRSPISGFKKRICRLLGIGKEQMKPISPIRYRRYYDLEENVSHWEVTEVGGGRVLLSDAILGSPEGGQVKEEEEIKELCDNLASLQRSPENFYIVEHILLRPTPRERTFTIRQASDSKTERSEANVLPSHTQAYAKDPYSLQLTVVLPEWAGRMAYNDFRKFAEHTIAKQRPAHQMVRFLWLDAPRMGRFEARYWAWRQKLKAYLETNGANHHEYRTVRNRLIDELGISASYPLPDLPVRPESNTCYQGEHPVIYIEYTEPDVWYLLYLKNEGEEASWTPTGVQLRSPGGQLKLIAPPLDQDVQVFYKIEARKYIKGLRLSRFLLDEEVVYIGVNENLDIHFDDGARMTVVDYNTFATAILDNSQDSITYQLFRDEDGQMPLSMPGFGNGAALYFEVMANPEPRIYLQEDEETIYVQAFKDMGKDGVADDPEHIHMIATELQVRVRPNPAVAFEPAAQIIDFGTGAPLTLPQPQASATYRVGAFQLPFAAFSFEKPAAGPYLTVLNDEGAEVYIGGTFAYTADFLESDSLKTGELEEDSLLFVEAYKQYEETEITQLLTQRAVVLVRPNPEVSIQWPGPVEAGKSADIILTGTQRGVHYQLYLDPEDETKLIPVGDPGYHYEDRAIETMRIEIDLLLDHAGQKALRLPTGVLAQAGSYLFRIFAIKTRTGVRQELSGSPGRVEVVA